jgi:hypothetical protein
MYAFEKFAGGGNLICSVLSDAIVQTPSLMFLPGD